MGSLSGELVYKFDWSKVQVIEFQLRLALGEQAFNLSKRHISVLAIMYLNPTLTDAKKIIIESGLRSSLKSIETNDIKLFKKEGILLVENGRTVFHSDLILHKDINLVRIFIN